MNASRTALLALALVACERRKGGAAPPPPPDAAGPLSPCTALARHTGLLAGGPEVLSSGDDSLCAKLSDEQIACGLVAADIDTLALCTLIRDPHERDAARRLTRLVRAAWPGTVLTRDVVGGAEGCAFVGVVGVPNEVEVVASFALRGGGVTENLVAWLHPGDAGDWTCTRTDPADQCNRILLACHRRR